MFAGMLDSGDPSATLPGRREARKDGETAVLEPAGSVLTPGGGGRRLTEMEVSP